MTTKIEKQYDYFHDGFNTLILIYTIFISFAIITIWSNFENSRKLVFHEASILNSIKLRAQNLNDNNILTNLKLYIESILENIKNYGNDIYEKQAYDKLNILTKSIIDNADSKLQDLVIELQVYSNIRNSNYLIKFPKLMWIFLITIVLFTAILFVFKDTKFFGLEKNLAMLFIYIIIGMIFVIIYEFDQPFSGNIQISIEPYKKLL